MDYMITILLLVYVIGMVAMIRNNNVRFEK